MFLHAITGVCTPVCLFTSRISVEAVTPPEIVETFFKELTSVYQQQTEPGNLDVAQTP